MNIDLTDSVRAFREIIAASWPMIERISDADTTGSLVDDWLQANWERVVEASIAPSDGAVLEPYGEGADCNVRSSRVWNPALRPNASVYARYIGNEELLNAVDGSAVASPIKFDHFATMDGNWPKVGWPFDYLVVDAENVVAVPAENLEFYAVLEQRR